MSRLVHVKPVWVCYLLLISGSFLPQSLGDRGPIFNWWLEQIVNYFGSLEFPQAGMTKGAVVILGM